MRAKKMSAPETDLIESEQPQADPASEDASWHALDEKEHTSHEIQPVDLSVDDITKTAAAAEGSDPLLSIILTAMVLFGGGGAMWKFIQQMGKAGKDLEKKRLEYTHELQLHQLALKSADYSSVQPPSCQDADRRQEQAVSHLADRVSELSESLDTMQAQFAKLAKKSAESDADFDADKLSGLVEKHEKEIKALKRRAADP
jgi:uncharacterized protein HemX